MARLAEHEVRGESSAVLAKATSDHCRAAFSYGSPAEVADYVSQYVEAGCTHVAICDLLPLDEVWRLVRGPGVYRTNVREMLV